AQVGFVDDVVVQQRGGVDELDDRSQKGVVRTLVAERSRNQQQQHRPHSLAAGRDDVIGHRVDQRHVGRQSGADHPVDLGEVGGDYGKQLGGLQDRSRRSGFVGARNERIIGGGTAGAAPRRRGPDRAGGGTAIPAGRLVRSAKLLYYRGFLRSGAGRRWENHRFHRFFAQPPRFPCTRS